MGFRLQGGTATVSVSRYEKWFEFVEIRAIFFRASSFIGLKVSLKISISLVLTPSSPIVASTNTFFRMFFVEWQCEKNIPPVKLGVRRVPLSFVTAPDLQKLQMTSRAHVTIPEKQVIFELRRLKILKTSSRAAHSYWQEAMLLRLRFLLKSVYFLVFLLFLSWWEPFWFEIWWEFAQE